MVRWLIDDCELAQYATMFEKLRVDGRALARLSATNSSYLTSVLGVANAVHRQKIRMQATNVVMFGYKSESHGAKNDTDELQSRTTCGRTCCCPCCSSWSCRA